VRQARKTTLALPESHAAKTGRSCAALSPLGQFFSSLPCGRLLVPPHQFCSYHPSLLLYLAYRGCCCYCCYCSAHFPPNFSPVNTSPCQGPKPSDPIAPSTPPENTWQWPPHASRRCRGSLYLCEQSGDARAKQRCPPHPSPISWLQKQKQKTGIGR
jgi:hypothetical protein